MFALLVSGGDVAAATTTTVGGNTNNWGGYCKTPQNVFSPSVDTCVRTFAPNVALNDGKTDYTVYWNIYESATQGGTYTNIAGRQRSISVTNPAAAWQTSPTFDTLLRAGNYYALTFFATGGSTGGTRFFRYYYTNSGAAPAAVPFGSLRGRGSSDYAYECSPPSTLNFSVYCGDQTC